MTPLPAEERLDLLAQAVAAASGEQTPREAAAAILKLLVERLDLDAGAFFVVRDDRSAEVLAAYGRTRQRGFPYPRLDGTAAPVAPLFHGVPHLEVRSPSDLPPALAAVACRPPAQVLLAAARAGDDVTGLLQLSAREARPLDEAVLQVVHLAAGILALDARNQLLSTETERSATILETAYAVSRAISRSLDLERTFKLIAVNAARLVRGTRCLLFELDPEGGDLVAVASSEDDDEPLLGLRLRFDGGRLAPRPASAAGQGDDVPRKPLQIAVEDLVWGAGVGAELRGALAMRTALFLPMLAQNELIGSLVLMAPRRAEPFPDDDVALAEEVAEQAAIAIHNARLYRDLAHSQARIEALLGRVTRIREHERRSLAGIVHDDILQSVVGVVYKLEAALDDLPPDAQPQLAEAIGVLRSAVDEARHVISDLRPPALEGLGLAAALQALVDRADSMGPAKVGAEVDRGMDLEPGTATALYKIAREAITNAQRHAHAQHVWVLLAEAGVDGRRCARLVVRDDGRGFAAAGPDDRPPEGHYGLSMMEEQATFAGGSLRLVARPGEGTTVEAVVPLPGGNVDVVERGAAVQA
jgi:signal transduction histidine kinase